MRLISSWQERQKAGNACLLGSLQVDRLFVQRGARMHAAHLQRHAFRLTHNDDLCLQ